jgi:hypothetical protein
MGAVVDHLASVSKGEAEKFPCFWVWWWAYDAQVCASACRAVGCGLEGAR